MSIAKIWQYEEHVYVDYECFASHRHRVHKDGGWVSEVTLVLPTEFRQQLPDDVIQAIREARSNGRLGYRVTREHWGL